MTNEKISRLGNRGDRCHTDVIGHGSNGFYDCDGTMSDVTFRERIKELKRIYFSSRSKTEVRHTAIGWQPDPSYIEDKNKTASGAREFYKVVRKPHGIQNSK